MQIRVVNAGYVYSVGFSMFFKVRLWLAYLDLLHDEKRAAPLLFKTPESNPCFRPLPLICGPLILHPCAI